MNCQDSQSQEHAYLDGELDLTRTLQVEEHLRECSLCSRAHDDLRLLQKSLRDDSLRFQAPTGLERKVRSALRRESRSRTQTLRWSWLIPAFSAAGLVIVLGIYFFTRAPVDSMVSSEIVSSHVRSMMTPIHLIDVPSEDPHTVKPWFDGKLDFSPPVKDLTPLGFTLIGGRLDYIANRPVAALIYQRRQHMINVFIWPAANAADNKPAAQVRQGYNLIQWTKSGMTYWAVSDLNLAELQQLAEDLQS
jgi:anti-sigma factor RsiW